MLISYVVTLYNKTRFLPYLCAGLMSQCGEFQREYIFVDDGSTDGTVDQLRLITAGWNNVTIICQSNAGPSVALNRAFAEARGTYVKPLDGDDMMLPWATGHLLKAAVETGAHFVTAVRAEQFSYQDNESLESLVTPPKPQAVGHLWNMLPHSLRSSQTQPSLWLATRKAVEAAGGCDGGVFVQDYSLELKMAALGPAAVVHGPMVRLGRGVGQLSENKAQTLHDCNAALLRFLAHTPELPSGLRRLALKRAAGRAWLWALRQGGARPLSTAHRLKLRADIGALSFTAQTEAALCGPFKATHTIRIPTASI